MTATVPVAKVGRSSKTSNLAGALKNPVTSVVTSIKLDTYVCDGGANFELDLLRWICFHS
jgi:hypothetical protein